MKTLLFALATIVLLAGPRVRGDTLIGTAITKVPTIISKPGKYRLAKDLTLTEGTSAIAVSASNVLIDFNGYTLTASGSANSANSFGVNFGASHGKVCNGTIVGFGTAVQAGTDDYGPLTTITVEEMTCESQLGRTAIDLGAADCVVTGCHVTNPSGGISTAVGIAVDFSGVIEDCTVSDLHASGSTATAYLIDDFGNMENYTDVLRHCVASNLTATGGSKTITGVLGAAGAVVVDDCYFYNLNTPIGAAGNGHIIVKNSTFRACGSSFVNTDITDGGSNTIVP